MICAQAVVHFRPQPHYEKYLKLLVSVMVLIQLFLPVGSFLLGGGGQEAAKVLEQFGKELEQSMREAVEHAAAADAILEQMTLEEIMRQLETSQEERMPKEAPREEPGSLSESVQEEKGSDAGQEFDSGTGEIEINLKIKAVEPVIINDAESSKSKLLP